MNLKPEIANHLIIFSLFSFFLTVNGIITKWRIRTNNFAISKAGTKVYFNNYETMDNVSIQKCFLAIFILLWIRIHQTLAIVSGSQGR